MAVDALQVTRSLLAYQVVNDKDSLVKLLKRNGVKLGMNPSDSEVTSAVLFASGKSSNFKKELATLLASNAKKASGEFASFVGQEMGFTGIDDFSFTGIEGFSNGVGDIGTPSLKISPTPTATVTAKAKKEGKTGAGKVLAWLGQNVFTKENIDTAVQVGLTKINTKTQNQANQVAQEGLAIQQYQDDIRNQQASMGKKGLSTGAWIGIGVGAVALVGIIIYLTNRKK
jgi:hypothetical protein